ncbi:MAG: bifunctional demethylmenaquinone methyltransferase/2-methoxy-6-polyprenyl-1,4-benzoquinol methylase UbiE [Acidobacteria bacterium]|nr:MAG: bifunctional demethylmenaquinone methyltransferase/2-methoxy-6-polyprenyl-1,4-benzoquinol methylase UbiE [Acidobacteriota bacterium]
MQAGRPVNTGRQIQRMFAAIAPRYDLLNHLLSLNIDRHWRRCTARRLAPVLSRPGARALDICCGTADLSLELSRYAPVIGLDFCHPMLVRGGEKIARRRAAVVLAEGDALQLPFPDDRFDAVTIAFGLRNLESPQHGLREMYRILKSGGRAAILEFSRPIVPVFSRLFGLYFKHILPRVGALVSGVDGPYQYLHDSVQSFPEQQELARQMEDVGFVNVTYHNLTGGIAALHLGEKP